MSAQSTRTPSSVCRALIAALILVQFCGCNQNVDLTSLQALAKTTASQTSAYAALTQDYLASCERRTTWEIAGQAGPAVAEDPAVALRTGLSHGYYVAPNGETLSRLTGTQEQAVQAALSYMGVPSDDPCKGNVDAMAQWQKVNLLVTNYVAALGTLAGGDQQQTTDYGLGKLADELTTTKIIYDKQQAAALKNAAVSLVNAVADARRRDAIAEFAPAAQGSLNVIIDDLIYVADRDYRGVLNLERDTVDSYYTRNLAATKTGLDGLAALQYTDRWVQDRATVTARYTAIPEYVNSLKALKSAHNALVMKIKSHQFSDFESIVRLYVSELGPEVEAINKVFSSGGKP